MKPCIRLPLGNAANARDLGGYYTTDHRITKWQTFIRADDMRNLDEADIAFLKDYGITTIIDLRSAGEVKKMPHPDFSGFEDFHVPLLAEKAVGDLMQMPASDMGETFIKSFYLDTLEDSKAQVKRVFEILHAAKGAALFHCVGGKDRTGMIAALLLGIAEVPDVDIVTNYEITFTNLMMLPHFHTHVSALEENGEAADHYYSKREYIQQVLRHLNENYGGARGYLLSCGISGQMLDDLKARFTEVF